MARAITRWQPDTCGCDIDIIIDTDAPDQPQFVVRKPCINHLTHFLSVGADASHVHRENVTKNKKLQQIQLVLADCTTQEEYDAKVTAKLDEKCVALFGADSSTFAPGDPLIQAMKNAAERIVSVRADDLQWEFDADRTLRVKLPKHVNKQKLSRIEGVLLE